MQVDISKLLNEPGLVCAVVCWTEHVLDGILSVAAGLVLVLVSYTVTSNVGSSRVPQF